MEKTQIKMDHDFAADFQPPAVEAKIMTHFNSAAVKIANKKSALTNANN